MMDSVMNAQYAGRVPDLFGSLSRLRQLMNLSIDYRGERRIHHTASVPNELQSERHWNCRNNI